MAKDVATRIAERNQEAEYHRRSQGVVRRTISGAGLAVANTWDRVTSPFKKDASVFSAATAFGAMQGAVYGALAGIGVMVLTMGGAMGAYVMSPVAIPAFVALTAIGAVVGGVRQGQTSLDRHWQASNHQVADTIAEKTGAVKAPMQFKGDVGSTPEEELRRTGHDPKLIQRAEAALENAPSFVKQEQERRAQRGGPTVLNR